MPFMTKDGFRLYYEDTGGNAPVIMFLHGVHFCRNRCRYRWPMRRRSCAASRLRRDR